MKLNKQIFIQHAKRIQFILNDSSPFLTYLKKESLITVLQSSLNVLYILEHKFVEIKMPTLYSSKSLIKNFNNLCKNDFVIKKPTENLSDDEIIDTINYLPIYCKNIFKVDIDQLIKNKKNINSNNHTDALANIKNPQYDINSNYDNNNFFLTDNFDHANFSNAAKKISYDFKKGNFYIYQSKTKLIPILKLILIVFLFFLSFALFSCCVFAILSKDLWVAVDGKEGQLGGHAIISGCVYAIIGLMTIYQIYLLINDFKSKNDNKIYHARVMLPFITIILAILMIAPDIKWTWLINQYIDKVLENQQLILGYYKMWKYLYLSIILLLIVSLIILITTMVFNPKINSKLLFDQLGKYVNEPISRPISKPNDNLKKENNEQKVSNKKRGIVDGKKQKNTKHKK